MTERLAYGLTVASVDHGFHPADSRHLPISTFEYAELEDAERFAHTLVADPLTVAVTIEGAGGEIVFNYPPEVDHA